MMKPLVIGAALAVLLVSGAQARPHRHHAKPQGIITCDMQGCHGSAPVAERPSRHAKRHHREIKIDANGNNIVRSSTGVRVRVAPGARSALQCVVDYVEAHGVKIVSMRGYGHGTVRGSLHPSGRALDINQTDRDVTRPAVPRHVSNGAADKCGVTSGARWHDADNGHWNLTMQGRR